jgi:HTH-type transcriptional regulator / antitoxin HipB
MRTFKAHLQEKLQDQQFKELFDEERELLRIGLEIAEAITSMGISQTELARRAHVTQQQASKIENGGNCNVLTLLRVCRVLSLTCRVNRAA